MNVLTLFTFIAVSSIFESSPGAAFSPQDLIAYHIAKRQTTTQNDVVGCSVVVADHQCDYAQQIVNIALGCRNEVFVRNTANACARNKNGESCEVAALKVLMNDTDLKNAYSNCLNAVTLGSQACPAVCRTYTESMNSKLGCCFNTYINTTESRWFRIYGQYFDYRLWSLCDVPLPTTECESKISFDPPQDARDCTEQEFVSRLVDFQCNASIGQPLINALLQNERCNIFTTILVDYCTTNANGQTCTEAIYFGILESVPTFLQMFSTSISLSRNCADAVNVDTCSPSCQSAITNFTDSYGCCVNLYNNSEGVQLASLSYNLLNLCGVDSPGFCNSSLTTSPSILPPTTDPLTTSTVRTSTGEITTTTTVPSTTDRDPSPTSPSTHEFDSSTSGSQMPPTTDPLTTSTVQTSTGEITTTTAAPSTKDQDPSPTSPSTHEFDSSTNSSRMLTPMNWIVAWASLLLLKNLL